MDMKNSKFYKEIQEFINEGGTIHILPDDITPINNKVNLNSRNDSNAIEEEEELIILDDFLFT